MVPEFKEAKSKSDSPDDQPKSSSNSMDLVPGVPPQISFELGSDQLSGLTILVDLWQMQKIVHPVGLSNILPILESMKRREQFPTDVIKTHDKVIAGFNLDPTAANCYKKVQAALNVGEIK